jgi:hypothetical protein
MQLVPDVQPFGPLTADILQCKPELDLKTHKWCRKVLAYLVRWRAMWLGSRAVSLESRNYMALPQPQFWATPVTQGMGEEVAEGELELVAAGLSACAHRGLF